MNHYVEEIKDIRVIKLLLSIDNIYESLSYDGSPELKDFYPEGVWFMLSRDDAIFSGFINLKAINNVMWSAHIYIAKDQRGNNSEQWGIQVADYMRKNYGAKKFLAFTPYEAAKKYAERMGFNLVATLSKSIQKDNQLLDQYLLEME